MPFVTAACASPTGIMEVPPRTETVRLLIHAGILLLALPLMAQSNTGELRLKVSDPHGLGTKASVTLTSDGAQLHRSLSTDDSGLLTARNLPFGLYQLKVEARDSRLSAAPSKSGRRYPRNTWSSSA